MKRAAWLFAASLAVAATSAMAAPAGAPPPASPSWLRPDKPLAKQPLEMQHGPSPLRVGGMLLLVASLGGVAFYARKRGHKLAPGETKAHLRVLGTTRVGAKATAVVVEVSGKRLLLGVTDQAVSTLAWLDDEQNAALEDAHEPSVVGRRTAGAAPLDDVVAASPSGFLRLLRNAVGTAAVPKAAAPHIARAAADEVAQATRDEVRLSRREPEEQVAFEGQVMGLARRRKETP